MSKIKEIRERLKKVTPGPWGLIGEGALLKGINDLMVVAFDSDFPDADDTFIVNIGCADPATDLPNGKFIAHSREDIPHLLDRLEAAENVLTRVLCLEAQLRAVDGKDSDRLVEIHQIVSAALKED